MSTGSKVTLILACGGTIGIIFYVHYKQWFDKQKLHNGVVRDIERQRKKKIENLYFLQQQIEMKKILSSQQSQDEAVSIQIVENSKKNDS